MHPILRIKDQDTFAHHRSGWRYAIDSLQPLHCDDGIRFLGFGDRVLHREEIDEPFVAFLHNQIPPLGLKKNRLDENCLDRTFNSPVWRRNENQCMGIFVLTKHLEKYVPDYTDVRCNAVVHPVEECSLQFSLDRYLRTQKIVHLGQWLRRFDSFYRLKCKQEKLLLQATANDGHLAWGEVPPGVEHRDWVPHEELDLILSGSVVFVHFFDVAACNTVLDCIVRNTPIVTNRLPANEEYLGSDYPLLFETLKEAEAMLRDDDKIAAGHEFLTRMDKSRFSGDNFLQSVYETSIVKNIVHQRRCWMV